jgi:hypothetical protein
MSRFRKHQRPEYRWCIKELSRVSDHLRRAGAEADILETATDAGRTDWEEVHWGGRRITLQNTDGLLITAYHMRDGDEVSFDLVFPTDPYPDWLLNPDGTWFEDLDLT